MILDFRVLYLQKQNLAWSQQGESRAASSFTSFSAKLANEGYLSCVILHFKIKRYTVWFIIKDMDPWIHGSAAGAAARAAAGAAAGAAASAATVSTLSCN